MSEDPGKRFYGGVVLGHSVEGGNFNSDWWRWEQRPGRIADDATSQTAADHWNRFDADFNLARKLGLNCMLVSIEWARIEPKPGEFDRDAIDHYAQVLKALNKRDITPIVALQAITLPAWFADKSAWTNPRAGAMFTQYVREVVPTLAPHCQHWLPQYRVYDTLKMACYDKKWPARSRVVDARAHFMDYADVAGSKAWTVIKEVDSNARIGVSVDVPDVLPFDEESPWDFWAARSVDFICQLERFDDPAEHAERIETINANLTKSEFDFWVMPAPGRRWARFALKRWRHRFLQPVDAEGVDTDFLYRESDPMRVAEIMRGMCTGQKPILFVGSPHHVEDDAQRCLYVLDHIEAIHALEADSVQRVMGYLHDAFLDGFEWHRGYSTRRGLVHVDWETQARTPNQSAYLLGDIARNDRITPGAVRKYCPTWESSLEHAT